MAINAYTGLMGHGKSYEVVANVILLAIASGRRLVTNVSNLQIEDIYAYLIDKRDIKPELLGSIVQIQNEDIPKSNFFPVELKEGQTLEDLPESVVKAGDLVVIDECWRWWAAGCKFDPAHMTFFRMHRHFVNNETSHSCDVVLIVQDVGDLDRKLKVIVENTYRMTKLKALGLPTRYRVDVFLSYKVTRAPHMSYQRKYDKEIFPLYKSYSQGAKAGNEVPIDNRANLFGGSFFRFVLPFLLIVCLPIALYKVYSFFSSSSATPTPVKDASSPASPSPRGASSASSSSLRPSAPLGLPPRGSSSDWRVLGYFKIGDSPRVLVYQPDKVRVLVDSRSFSFDGQRVNGVIDGLPVSQWSGTSVAVNSGAAGGGARGAFTPPPLPSPRSAGVAP